MSDDVIEVARAPHATVRFAFDNTYAQLPERFYARVSPTRVGAPALVRINAALADSLGLDAAALASPEGVAILAGNRLPPGAAPIATAYAGHQFGGFSPQLGDGRAILLGEIVGRDGRRRDIQLKGSGPTPFSRLGDGRAALGPVLREYLISEAMAALGVPTTRALAAVTTGETVRRETALPGAVLTRVAASHIRIGTFQYFAAQQDWAAVRVLADYAIDRHCPHAREAEQPYRALLDAIIARQAALVAQWLLIGFIHGVMNTDNMAVSGETIDYGPCAFMDSYDQATVFSSIDVYGRYAYGNQPPIAHWNLARLADALLPLLALDPAAAAASAHEALAAFAPLFQRAYHAGLQRKIGLATTAEGDAALVQDLLAAMAEHQADFTTTFRHLSDAAARPLEQVPAKQAPGEPASAFTQSPAFVAWHARWQRRLQDDPAEPAARRAAMQAVNPAYVPRNHLVEEAIAAAVERQDFAPFEQLLSVLADPYQPQPGRDRYARPPGPEARVYQTFCGT